MKTKEAIAYLSQRIGVDSVTRDCADIVIAALAASQKREREMFKALSKSCKHADSCGCGKELIACTRRTCPLLKPVEKPFSFSDCKKKGVKK